MSEQTKVIQLRRETPVVNALELLFDQLRTAVLEDLRKELKATADDNSPLLTPEELAEHLNLKTKNGKLKVSWVYEQSRLGNIPTHRVGKYIRFNLTEVLESLKKNKN
jgi:hypothetical protein